jgi:hypothetical protein
VLWLSGVTIIVLEDSLEPIAASLQLAVTATLELVRLIMVMMISLVISCSYVRSRGIRRADTIIRQDPPNRRRARQDTTAQRAYPQ